MYTNIDVHRNYLRKEERKTQYLLSHDAAAAIRFIYIRFHVPFEKGRGLEVLYTKRYGKVTYVKWLVLTVK